MLAVRLMRLFSHDLGAKSASGSFDDLDAERAHAQSSNAQAHHFLLTTQLSRTGTLRQDNLVWIGSLAVYGVLLFLAAATALH